MASVLKKYEIKKGHEFINVKSMDFLFISLMIIILILVVQIGLKT